MTTKTKDFSAGEFRFPVVVQKNIAPPDNYGGQGKPEWVEAMPPVWCKIIDRGGSEGYGDGTTGRIRSTQGKTFVTWWNDDILTTHRLVWQNRAYNIGEVNNVEERNKFTEIVADTGVET